MCRVRELIHQREDILLNSSGDVASFPFQKLNNPQMHRLLQCIYILCKVCKFKEIIKLLPHEVFDLEPVFRLLQSQDRNDHVTWEIRYSLLLWMSILVLIPFDLQTVDSSLVNGTVDDRKIEENTLVSSIIRLGKNYLSDTGPIRDIAATCLARLLTRYII